MRALAGLVVLAMPAVGCGRLGFDETGSDADVPLGSFGAPTRIVELSVAGTRDDDPSLTADQLEIFFNSERAGGPGSGDIWTATRAAADAPWSTPTLVAAMSSAASETGPEISADGLTCYFASDRAGTLGRTDIWVTTRATRSAPWTTPVHVPELSSADDDTAPAIHANGLVIVLESTRGGDPSLFLATRATVTSPWSAPQPIAVSTNDAEGSPYLSHDGRAILYNAIRAGGAGMADLYIATRASDSAAFANELRLSVSAAANEEDPWLSDDGRALYFASNQTGDVEIYEARR